MSGTESSAPAAQPALELPGLAVHRAHPAAAARVRGGRLRLLLLCLAFALPVLASYLSYYVIRPQGRTNYGTLIQPSRTLPADLALRGLDGAALAPDALRGQWLLVALGSAACDRACEQRLYLQRQLREMLGRERDRIDRVWLITDGGQPSAALQAALQATGPMRFLHADAPALARWLAPQAGQALAGHLYIVDPMGEWMMRWPVEPDPQKMKKDLDRLLRASASWDRAGRD